MKIVATDTVKFNLGDVVSLKIGGEETGMITSITFRLDGGTIFSISWSDRTESAHFANELTLESAADEDLKKE